MTASPEPRRYLIVAEEILAAVALGNLSAGDRLPNERELARRCSVSRSTVREALLALELGGMVETRRGAGYFLLGAGSHPSIPLALPVEVPPRELIEVRLLLEPAAAASCASRIGREEVDRLGALVDGAERAGKSPDRAGLDRFLQLNLEFHLLIARTCANPIHAAITSQLIAAENQPLWTIVDGIVVRDEKIRAMQINEHRAILTAIATGEKELAAKAMEEHLVALSSRIFGTSSARPSAPRRRRRTSAPSRPASRSARVDHE